MAEAVPVGGHATVVAGADLTGSAVLWVRREALDADADARRACASEHVTRLIQRLPERRSRVGPIHAVLLEHPEGGTLEDRLRVGPPLRTSEAVTILLGVATALSDLHAAGWGGALPRPEQVAFRADGCPVLAWLQRPGPLDDDAEAADRRAFRSLSRAVCDAVADDAGRRLLTTIADVTALRGWERVRAALLREAQPGVVTLPTGPPGSPDARGRLVPPVEAVATTPADERRPLAERFMAAVESDPVRRLLGAMRGRLRRRPGLVAVAVAPLALAVLLLVLLPAPGGGVQGEGDARGKDQGQGQSASSSQKADGAVGRAGPSTSATSSGNPAMSPATSATSPADLAARPPATDPLLGDEPVAAARVLLERRHACFAGRKRSTTCLDGLIQRGTDLLTQEKAALGHAGTERADAAAERDYAKAEVTLVQRWARAALVTVAPKAEAESPQREPASLLLVRSEAGWRLREVFP